MKISKDYGITLSHKFANGDIGSIRLGTRIEMDAILDAASDDVLDQLQRKLAKQARLATKADLKAAIKADKAVKEIYRGMQESEKEQREENEGE